MAKTGLTKAEWDAIGVKTCCQCGATKLLDNFYTRKKYRNREARYYSNCKACANKATLASRFRIPPKKYLALLEAANGICEICNASMNPPCLDHNHETGAIRGLLCNACNTALQLIERNYANAFRAIEYLEKYKDAELDKNAEWRRNEYFSERYARYRNKKCKNLIANS